MKKLLIANAALATAVVALSVMVVLTGSTVLSYLGSFAVGSLFTTAAITCVYALVLACRRVRYRHKVASSYAKGDY